jgi:hypothetical protein
MAMDHTGQIGVGAMIWGGIRLILFFGILAAIAFIAAGTIRWPMMWAFPLFYLGMMTVNMPLIDLGLPEERLHPEDRVKSHVEHAGRMPGRLISRVW